MFSSAAERSAGLSWWFGSVGRLEKDAGIQHVSPPGHRVAVWRFARYPQMLPDDYLRLLGS